MELNQNRRIQQMILSMKAKGLTPVVTLNHFTFPLWVMTPPDNLNIINNGIPSTDPYFKSLRGWENKQTIMEYLEYTSFCRKSFKRSS